MLQTKLHTLPQTLYHYTHHSSSCCTKTEINLERAFWNITCNICINNKKIPNTLKKLPMLLLTYLVSRGHPNQVSYVQYQGMFRQMQCAIGRSLEKNVVSVVVAGEPSEWGQSREKEAPPCSDDHCCHRSSMFHSNKKQMTPD